MLDSLPLLSFGIRFLSILIVLGKIGRPRQTLFSTFSGYNSRMVGRLELNNSQFSDTAGNSVFSQTFLL
jgi:hypothetical protein